MQSEPKRMKRSTNEVIKYPCDKCEYAASSAGSLKQLQMEQFGTMVDPYCFWNMELLDLGPGFKLHNKRKEY